MSGECDRRFRRSSDDNTNNSSNSNSNSSSNNTGVSFREARVDSFANKRNCVYFDEDCHFDEESHQSSPHHSRDPPPHSQKDVSDDDDDDNNDGGGGQMKRGQRRRREREEEEEEVKEEREGREAVSSGTRTDDDGGSNNVNGSRSGSGGDVSNYTTRGDDDSDSVFSVKSAGGIGGKRSSLSGGGSSGGSQSGSRRVSFRDTPERFGTGTLERFRRQQQQVDADTSEDDRSSPSVDKEKEKEEWEKSPESSRAYSYYNRENESDILSSRRERLRRQKEETSEDDASCTHTTPPLSRVSSTQERREEEEEDSSAGAEASDVLGDSFSRLGAGRGGGAGSSYYYNSSSSECYNRPGSSSPRRVVVGFSGDQTFPREAPRGFSGSRDLLGKARRAWRSLSGELEGVGGGGSNKPQGRLIEIPIRLVSQPVSRSGCSSSSSSSSSLADDRGRSSTPTISSTCGDFDKGEFDVGGRDFFVPRDGDDSLPVRDSDFGVVENRRERDRSVDESPYVNVVRRQFSESSSAVSPRDPEFSVVENRRDRNRSGDESPYVNVRRQFSESSSSSIVSGDPEFTVVENRRDRSGDESPYVNVVRRQFSESSSGNSALPLSRDPDFSVVENRRDRDRFGDESPYVNVVRRQYSEGNISDINGEQRRPLSHDLRRQYSESCASSSISDRNRPTTVSHDRLASASAEAGEDCAGSGSSSSRSLDWGDRRRKSDLQPRPGNPAFQPPRRASLLDNLRRLSAHGRPRSSSSGGGGRGSDPWMDLLYGGDEGDDSFQEFERVLENINNYRLSSGSDLDLDRRGGRPGGSSWWWRDEDSASGTSSWRGDSDRDSPSSASSRRDSSAGRDSSASSRRDSTCSSTSSTSTLTRDDESDPDNYPYGGEEQDRYDDSDLGRGSRGRSRSRRNNIDEDFLDFFDHDEDFMEFERELERIRAQRRSRLLQMDNNMHPYHHHHHRHHSSGDIFDDVRSFCDRSLRRAGSRGSVGGDGLGGGGGGLSPSSASTSTTSISSSPSAASPGTSPKVQRRLSATNSSDTALWNSAEEWGMVLNKLRRNSRLLSDQALYDNSSSSSNNYYGGYSSDGGRGVGDDLGSGYGAGSSGRTGGSGSSSSVGDYVPRTRTLPAGTTFSGRDGGGGGGDCGGGRSTRYYCPGGEDCQYTCHLHCLPKVTLDCVTLSPGGSGEGPVATPTDLPSPSSPPSSNLPSPTASAETSLTEPRRTIVNHRSPHKTSSSSSPSLLSSTTATAVATSSPSQSSSQSSSTTTTTTNTHAHLPARTISQNLTPPLNTCNRSSSSPSVALSSSPSSSSPSSSPYSSLRDPLSGARVSLLTSLSSSALSTPSSPSSSPAAGRGAGGGGRGMCVEKDLNQNSAKDTVDSAGGVHLVGGEEACDVTNEKDETDSGYRSGTIPEDKLPKAPSQATLNRMELRRKIQTFNHFVPNAALTQKEEDEETFQGFLRVTLNLIRPITMELGARPPSIYELLTREHIVEQSTQHVAFYMPRDTVKSIHISSKTTTKEVVTGLLKKFHILDHPRKFAMYEQEFNDKNKLVKLRRLNDKDCPLVSMLAWEVERVKHYRLVLQENETGEIVWENFSEPELKNFQIVLDREEGEAIAQLQYKYRVMKRIILQRMKELRQERHSASATTKDSKAGSSSS